MTNSKQTRDAWWRQSGSRERRTSRLLQNRNAKMINEGTEIAKETRNRKKKTKNKTALLAGFSHPLFVADSLLPDYIEGWSSSSFAPIVPCRAVPCCCCCTSPPSPLPSLSTALPRAGAECDCTLLREQDEPRALRGEAHQKGIYDVCPREPLRVLPKRGGSIKGRSPGVS
jgi:hypothetical protein